MAFRKPGNSRDDRPSGSSGRNAKDGKKDWNKPSDSRSSAPKSNNKNGSDSPRAGRRPNTGSADRASNTDKPYGDRPSRGNSSDRPYTGRPERGASDKPYGDRPSRGTSSDRPYSGRPERSASDKPFGERPKRTSSDRPYSPRAERSGGDKPYGDRPSRGASDRPYSGRPERSSEGGEKSYGDRPSSRGGSDRPTGDRPYRKPSLGEKSFSRRPPSTQRPQTEQVPGKDNRGYTKTYEKREKSRPGDYDANGNKPERTLRAKKPSTTTIKDDGLMRLNRYISNAGICSRRKADELIMAGVVSVNGEVISELGHKVDPYKDVIKYNGETLKREKNVYVLLNKPKDYLTTTDDPMERRTVMQLVDKASKERIYPVGRLDRNTTGLLLMTNDGDLADKLSHPKNNISKLYMVELDKGLIQGDLNKIGFGLELEDGFIKPDSVSYVAGGTKKEVGIQIHSGRNRIVRRIFEHLGYEVVKLDRSVYANLTKKDLPRGRWRYLDEKEVIQLKHLV
ncbi:pseudouridine synthase [Mucilaginibacter polytrichastri]|uniref:Pseudouridine synthase n=1 Tax=Mucilaginibacter polytrichastri TaxID=1302689 RepID=A0A1Q6A317_9SPHI|nr:pseudouridine synthase [Mucilaginibacter polytrichastri]OKS88407.1 hypothetical protein RG47T_3874 [Mucilaginibacter polytrichastri]SFT14333.1 23S rRNA pseudouridine2605 synthase [Mucilaginibacter polytrichastri]